MWFKFKNVAALIIETFHLLLITLLLGNPFNVKPIDDIAVMASTATKTTLATIIANSGDVGDVSGKQAAIALITTASETSTNVPEAPAAAAATSLFLLETTTATASELYNLNFQRIVDENDSSEIDSMNTNESGIEDEEEEEEEEEKLFLKNYIMTKHIALSNITRKGAEEIRTITTSADELTTLTTKLISPIVLTSLTTMNSATAAAASAAPSSKISTTTTATTSTLTPSSSSSTSSLSSSEFDQQRFNKTQLDVLASLSLLSLNDGTASATDTETSTTELKAPTSAVSSSSSVSTLKFSNNVATALRHQGNEQNMHNTNSHLTVDNVNATIVSSSSTGAGTGTSRTTATSSATSSLSNISLQHNTSTITKKSSSSSDSSSRSSSGNSIRNSGSSTTSSGGGGGGISSSSSSSAAITTTTNNNSNNTGNNSSRINTGTTRISARKVDSKYLLSKSHKTDAPMLNYIFDTFSSANKHHHHDQRYGPHFEDVQLVGQPTNMTVQAGSSIHLNCRISLLQDKTVSWVRRNAQGENALDLLTVGLHAYTGDKRYKMEFQYPSNWRLKINNVKKDDEATYECQISTHPPRVIQINLFVNAPKVMIVDEFGDPLQEKYYEQDSTLQLSCVVRNVAMSTSVVYWRHSEDILNYDVTRGGVSVKTELMDDGANSTLFIAKINKADSGNYTCSISEYQNYTIMVHILNGESFAELHHGCAIGWRQLIYQNWIINLILATILLLLLPAYIHR